MVDTPNKICLMNRFNVILSLILLALIILHLSWTIDYNHLFITSNKAGATGVFVSLLGLISLWLSIREESGQRNRLS